MLKKDGSQWGRKCDSEEHLTLQTLHHFIWFLTEVVPLIATSQNRLLIFFITFDTNQLALGQIYV